VQFSTTDALSGIDHYELKVIPLKIQPREDGVVNQNMASQPLFIDAVSPYVTPELDRGTYDIIIRSYDIAGNYQESVEHLAVVAPLFSFVSSDGVQFGDSLVISWLYVAIFMLVCIILLGLLSIRVRRWHRKAFEQKINRELPNNVQTQLGELMKYREKYGKIAALVLVLLTSLVSLSATRAQNVEVTPPVITTVSRNISNNEIFYVGGKIDTSSSTVVIYLQNLSSGETISESAVSDKKGDWFYRHDGFLSSGNYLLWVQSKIGSLVSPPSPQVELVVHTTALQIGGTRLSLEGIYSSLLVLAILIALCLIIYIAVHAVRAKKHLAHVMHEVREAEESVRRGFAVLRRDIQAELAVIHKAKLSKEISAEEEQKEKQLLRDLESVEKYIGKEIWDVEKVARE
jgi:uncharacterized membrane protein